MAIQIDPEQNERAALARIGARFDGARILEIGAGDGRLTKTFAPGAMSVVALETDREAARDFASQTWPPHVELVPVGIDAFEPAGRAFDVVVFSWSL
jgi:16S rRNA A1518/A1519 N6-dimethyltransferase RsmA/KsgA/DIM1 with predicted DNA glycosylase/AP lyase activity